MKTISFNDNVGVGINELDYERWVTRVVETEAKGVGELTYIFCDDDYLLELNQRYLQHDTFTDIITFDYTDGNILSGDIFISIPRVKENAMDRNLAFENELRRVMAHGVLHLSGYADKTETEIKVMRKKEEEKMKLFHVEH